MNTSKEFIMSKSIKARKINETLKLNEFTIMLYYMRLHVLLYLWNYDKKSIFMEALIWTKLLLELNFHLD